MYFFWKKLVFCVWERKSKGVKSSICHALFELIVRENIFPVMFVGGNILHLF